jgi:hypothetical protein
MPWHPYPSARGRAAFWGGLLLTATLAHGLSGPSHGLWLLAWVVASLVAFILPVTSLRVRGPSPAVIALATCLLIISCLTWGTIELSYGRLYGADLLLLAGFSLTGVVATGIRRRVEEQLEPEPGYLKAASEWELDLLVVVLKLEPLSPGNVFSELATVLGDDPFDTAVQRVREAGLSRLITARYLFYRYEDGCSTRVLRTHPQAPSLLEAERARREAQWSQPAPKPGPRQRPSMLAERVA